jgi:5'-3' exonuclease
MEALIDADIVAYRCACTCEEDDTDGIVLSRCNELVERIITNVSANSYTLFLSGGANFRKEIDPQYKANRIDKPKPKWLETCREYLVHSWNAKVTDGIEADDALGIAQHEESYICSIDKDLLQIPGMHYNFVKEEEYYISEREGLQRFWTQMIVGDTADNVFGIRGLGPKKTEKIFANAEGDTLEELDLWYYNTVSSLYNDPVRMHTNARLLWVLRDEGQIWVNPMERTEAGLKLSSQIYLKPITFKQATNQPESNSPNPLVNEPILQTGQ